VWVLVHGGSLLPRLRSLFVSLLTLCWTQKSSILMSGTHFDAKFLSAVDFCRSSQVRSAVVCALGVSA